MKGLFGKDRVCAVVAAESAREMGLQVRLGLRKTRTLELRLDYLRNSKERVAFLAWLARKRPVPGASGAMLKLKRRRVWPGANWCAPSLQHV